MGIHTISTIGGVPMVLMGVCVSCWFLGGLFSVADCFVEIELFVQLLGDFGKVSC